MRDGVMDSNTIEVEVTAAAAALTYPVLMIGAGKARPTWSTLSGIMIPTGSPVSSISDAGRVLEAIALSHMGSGGVIYMGWRWWAGVMPSQSSVLPLQLSGDGIISLINRALQWDGRVHAPWGIAVWTYAALTAGDRIQISYVMGRQE